MRRAREDGIIGLDSFLGTTGSGENIPAKFLEGHGFRMILYALLQDVQRRCDGPAFPDDASLFDDTCLRGNMGFSSPRGESRRRDEQPHDEGRFNQTAWPRSGIEAASAGELATNRIAVHLVHDNKMLQEPKPDGTGQLILARVPQAL